MSSLNRNFTIAVAMTGNTHDSQLDNLSSRMSQTGFNLVRATQNPTLEAMENTSALKSLDDKQPVELFFFIPRRPEQFSSPTQLMSSLSPLRDMPQVSGYEVKPGVVGVPMIWQRHQRQLKAVA